MKIKKSITKLISGFLFAGIVSGFIILSDPVYSSFYMDKTGEDSVVTDPVTGLMWEVKTDSNKSDTYTWADAIDYCENTMDGYGGYSDWRLPHVKELFSLIDVNKARPYINEEFFPNTESESDADCYWSSTTSNSSTSNAFAGSYYSPRIYYYSKTGYSHHVRCVRCSAE